MCDLDSVILYAACLEGSDPIRLFEKRINARRGTHVFDLCFASCSNEVMHSHYNFSKLFCTFRDVT